MKTPVPTFLGSIGMISLSMHHMVTGGLVPLYTYPQVKGSCHLQKGFLEATCLSVAS